MSEKKKLTEEEYSTKYLSKEEKNYDGYERALVMKAINNALAAFYKTFEDEGVDAAYFRPKITVGFRDSTFENDLERITYEDLY